MRRSDNRHWLRGEMVRHCAALARRFFPERQFLLRSGEKVCGLRLPGWTQALGLLAVLAFIGGVGGLFGAYQHAHKTVHQKEAEADAATARVAALAGLRQSLAQADEQYAQMSQRFAKAKAALDAADADNQALRSAIESVEARVSEIDKVRHQLEQILAGADKALANKGGNVSRLAKELAESKGQLQADEDSRAKLENQLFKLRADSATTATHTRQLTESLTMQERELRRIGNERDRLRDQVDQADGSGVPGTYVAKLEQLIASTGIDLNRYFGKYERPSNEGGPFIALAPERERQLDAERQKQLEAVVQSLPLAAPLVHYTVTSPYGPRIDPINHQLAFHAGIDFAAPYKSPVLATAPGVVTFTGWRGAYGRLVEIRHAHGVVTRYSHLNRILVAVGQEVTLNQEIGELGSTGRSTGPHVYYEVLVDGEQIDPAKFLEAGRSVELIKAAN